MKINFRLVISLLGVLLSVNGVCMLLCLALCKAFYFDCSSRTLAFSALICFASSFILRLFSLRIRDKTIKKREGVLVVSIGWVVMSVSGAIPFMIDGCIPSFTNAFFESMSGFTTTGVSVLTDVEILSPDILLWRSFTQLIGGIGIIVLAVAILPFLGIGGMQLFMTETSALVSDKLQPRVREVAKRLVMIYMGLIVALIVALYFAGMPLFDAVNHALPTIATGGFSIKNASIGYYESSLIEYIIIVFMILGGTNFTLLYFAFKGKFRKLFFNEEFLVFIGFIVVFSLICGVAILHLKDHTYHAGFRAALFTIVSSITTTGFVTADFSQWSPFLSIIILLTMFFGACAGSTSGGVKIVRHIILLKNSFVELKRQLHPAAVLPVRLNGKAVSQSIVYSIKAFIIMYLIVFTFSTVFICATGHDILTSATSVATCMGNIGLPAYNETRALGNFFDYSPIAKWILAFDMLVGRLELFAVLVLLTVGFWRRN